MAEAVPPLVLHNAFSRLSSSGECPSFTPRTRTARSRAIIAGMAPKSSAASSLSSLTLSPHRALFHLETSSLPCSCDSYGSSYIGSSGRRKLLFMSSITFLFPPHSLAEKSDAAKLLTIQNSLRDVLSKAKAPGMLRLAFHDAGTYDVEDHSGGMNGSILYELGRPENADLNKSIKILEKAKMEIDKILKVSWADLIAVAGAEAVFLCGGPAISVKVGRLDVRKPDQEGKLPQETLDASGLKNSFKRKGFYTQELVALSGAHTLGSKGFGNPNVFDNAYYKILLEKPWTSSDSMSNMIGLPSDHSLADDDECLRNLVGILAMVASSLSDVVSSRPDRQLCRSQRGVIGACIVFDGALKAWGAIVKLMVQPQRLAELATTFVGPPAVFFPPR